MNSGRDGLHIAGHVEAGFEPVREAFEANFREGLDLGAACAVWRGGRFVVDLWGGMRDHRTGALWERDTLVGVFSVTKAIAAIALAMLHSRGLLDYDQRVAAYWPEFAQAGKEHMTVRQLLSHQAGLPMVDERIDAGLLADRERFAAVLARQRPCWTPGRKHGYHAVSLGYFAGALFARIDPQHRSIGRFIREEIAEKLGVEFYVGAPRDLPRERIAEIKDYRLHELLYRPLGIPLGLVGRMFLPWSLSARAFLNPKVSRPTELLRSPLLHVEMPASNGIGTARAVAKMLGVLAAGGSELGISPRTIAELEAPARIPAEGDFDLVLRTRVRYGLGVAKPLPGFEFGSNDRAYGAAGLGGSLGMADPETGMGYAYIPSRSGFFLWNDPRERRIREAVFRCFRNEPQRHRGTEGDQV